MSAPVGAARVEIIADLAPFGREAAAGVQAGLKPVVGTVEAALKPTIAVAEKSGQAMGRAFGLAAVASAEASLARMGVVAGAALRTASEAGVAASGQQAVAAGRSATAAEKDAAAQARDAEAATANAAAKERLAAVMAGVAGVSAKEQQATLRAAAATERQAEVNAASSASFRQLASAQASAIGASSRLAAVQAESGAAAAASQGAFARLGAGLTSLTGISGRTAAGLGIAFGAFEVIKKGIDITKEANEFQRSMVQVQTNADVSASEVNKASTALLNMAGPVAAAPEDLAVAWYHAKSVGLDYAKSIDTTRIAAEGARVGHADLEETMNALTSTVASNIPGVKNMSVAMGQLIAIVGSGDMKLKDLNEALGSGILTVVKGYGLSLTDVGAALATFGDNNIRGAVAATMLRLAVQSMAVPAKAGADELRKLGLNSSTLAQDMQQGGLNKAVLDLKGHLDAAHVSSKQVGAVLTEVFGKRAGPGIAVLIGQVDRLESKFKVLRDSGASFSSKWKATTQTASFAIASFTHTLEAAGIAATAKLGPAIASVTRGLIGLVRGGIEVAKIALAPFVAAWEFLAPVLGKVGDVLGTVGHFLAPLAPVLEGVAGAAGAMFFAFKAGQLVSTIVRGIAVAVTDMAAVAQVQFTNVVASVAGVPAATTAAAAAVTADMSVIGDEAALMSGEFDAAAASAVASSAVIADASTAAAETVVAEGEAASIGWAGVAGPIGLAAVGILAVVSMFHRSTGASKEATAAAKAYTEALQGNGGKASIVDSITKQLQNNNVSAEINTINRSLGQTAVNGKEFVDAIQAGGQPLETLRSKLQGIVTAGTSFKTVVAGRATNTFKVMTPAAEAAAAALGHLNTQFNVLTKAQKKDLVDTKTFAGASSSITNLAVSTRIGTDAAKTYAEMAGFIVDKQGVVAASSKSVQAGIANVANAYNTATQTGSQFLDSLKAFSASTGSASDRAKLIGATLVAANGDGLMFAAAMNASATATKQLGTDIASAAKGVGKSGESVRSFIKSIVNLKDGTIDYSNAAATPLINDLQGMQTAAMNAAQAQFQHSRALKGGKAAADDAYGTYVKLTRGALVGQAKQLGLTTTQAKRLADQYFGMPKDVKTKIESEGQDKVVDVLNRIGQQLAFLTGHPWKPVVSIEDQAQARVSAIQTKINSLRQSHKPGVEVEIGQLLRELATAQARVDALHGKQIQITARTDAYVFNHNPQNVNSQPTSRRGTQAVGTRARFGVGTMPANTRTTVGEAGWEELETDSQGRARIYSHSQSEGRERRESEKFSGVAKSYNNPARSVKVTTPDNSGLLAEISRKLDMLTALPGLAPAFADALNGVARNGALIGRSLPGGYFAS